MRKVKFRVWNANEKEFLNELEFLIGPKGEIFPVHEHWDGFEIETDNDMSANGWIALQYTGLKLNKTEIYEGDIIEYNNCDYMRTGGHLDDEIVRGVVEFKVGAFWINGDLLIDVLENDEEARIIGNIFEHDYLLEEGVQNES